MKLWQAILIGCDRRAQTFGNTFVTFLHDGSIKSCALGAAYEGTTGMIRLDPAYPDRFLFLEEKFPMLNNESLCPVCGGEATSVETTVIHLNDNHMWTRERIALEFLKPIEEEAND